MKNENPCFECIGGPLCGTRVEDAHDTGRFVYEDDDESIHFYRLIRIENDERTAGVTFFHYYGGDQRAAMRGTPRIIPYKQLARASRRK
jgi:hypothetical protein